MKKPTFRVYVFSLPRCGSSMMTGIIERLGVEMIYTTEDEESRKKMQEVYKKKFGEYVPNEHFYEITKNQFENWVKIYNTPYSGCKVIIPVNGMRWEAVCSQPSKVIMMMRDPSEIRQSQEAFYKKARADYNGPDGSEEMEPWEHAEECLKTLLANTQLMLQGRTDLSNSSRFKTISCDTCGAHPSNGGTVCIDGDPNTCFMAKKKGIIMPFDFKVVNYRDVLGHPKESIIQIAQFIEADMDLVDYAVGSIDPSKIRFKKEELSEGI